jgi:SprT protein
MANYKYQGLEPYLPQGALDLLEPLLNKYPLQVLVAKPRTSKFGDYRFPRKGSLHRISVNGNLNCYHFLITLIHEYAHLEAYMLYGKNINPHGEEWQETFRLISAAFLEQGLFPDDVGKAFIDSLERGHASSARSLELMRVLKNYDSKETRLSQHLEDLVEGDCFILNQKLFRKGAQSRKRFKCEELRSGRFYMVHPLAEVTLYTLKND